MRLATIVCSHQVEKCVAVLFTSCLAPHHYILMNCSTQLSITFLRARRTVNLCTTHKSQLLVSVNTILNKINLMNYGHFSAERFQRYHFGSTKMNMKVYGTPEPPPYNLKNVRTNIHIMHGTNDWLTPSIVS